MKLKEFNAETLPKLSGGGKGVPRISFSKGGVININATACELIGLKPSDKITLAQDEEDPVNWYIYKNEKGFELRSAYDKKGVLFNHNSLTKEIMKAIEYDDTLSHNFIIAGQATTIKGDKTKYWGILVTAKV